MAIFSLLLLVLTAALAQESKSPLPVVAAAQVPLYPPLARAAQIQGDVILRVTTDGNRVVGTRIEKGHPMLARFAEENVRTWTFSTHEGTTFTVIYQYKIVEGLKSESNNPIVTLRLPNQVEVSTTPMPPLDQGR